MWKSSYPKAIKKKLNRIKDQVTNTGVLRFLILADSSSQFRPLWDAATSQFLDAKDQEQRVDRKVRDPQDSKKIIGFWADMKRTGTNVPQDFAEPSNFDGALIRDGEKGEIVSVEADELRLDPAGYFHKRKNQESAGADGR